MKPSQLNQSQTIKKLNFKNFFYNIRMHRNNKNTEEQLQQPSPIRKQVKKEFLDKNPQKNYWLIQQGRCKYFILFILLLQLIFSVVIVVLFMTLNYIGFDSLNSKEQSNKISVNFQTCQNPYLREKSKFISLKIKTAFISMSFQLVVSFVFVLLALKLAMKLNTIQKSIYKMGFSTLKQQLRWLYVLLSLSVLTVVVTFGIYLQFLVERNSNKIQEDCRLTMVNKQVTAIVAILGAMLVFILAALSIILCKIHIINQIVQRPKQKTQVFRLPQINQLKSRRTESWKNQRDILEGNIKAPNLGRNANEQNFKQLKTEDYLLQLKNHQNHNKMLEQNKEELQQGTDRRFIVYKPDQKQFFHQLKQLVQPCQRQHEMEKTYGKDEYYLQQRSVGSSLGRDIHQNLLLESIARPRDNCQLGFLPFNSKRFSGKSFDSQKLDNIKNLQYKPDIKVSKNQFPSKDSTKINKLRTKQSKQSDQFQSKQQTILIKQKKMQHQKQQFDDTIIKKLYQMMPQSKQRLSQQNWLNMIQRFE